MKRRVWCFDKLFYTVDEALEYAASKNLTVSDVELAENDYSTIYVNIKGMHECKHCQLGFFSENENAEFCDIVCEDEYNELNYIADELEKVGIEVIRK